MKFQLSEVQVPFFMACKQQISHEKQQLTLPDAQCKVYLPTSGTGKRDFFWAIDLCFCLMNAGSVFFAILDYKNNGTSCRLRKMTSRSVSGILVPKSEKKTTDGETPDYMANLFLRKFTTCIIKSLEICTQNLRIIHFPWFRYQQKIKIWFFVGPHPKKKNIFQDNLRGPPQGHLPQEIRP